LDSTDRNSQIAQETYLASLAPGPATGKKPAKTKRPRRTEPAIRTYVFSRTLKTISNPEIELVARDAVKFVAALKQQPGKGICLMGGGELAQALLAADLVDRIGLNIHPVLLGSGIPAFRDPGKRVKLKLTECRAIDGGCILANYQVMRGKTALSI